MKIKLITMAALVSLLLTQCKKETVIPVLDEKTAFLEMARKFVQQEVPVVDFAQLDWGKAIAYEKDSAYKMVRVPLRGNTGPGQKAVYLSYGNGRFTGNYFELVNNTVTTVSLDNRRKCIAPIVGNGQVTDYKVYENGLEIEDYTAIRYAINPQSPLYIYGDFNLYYQMVMLGLGQGGVGGDVNTTPQGTVSYLEAPDETGGTSGNGLGGGEILEIELDSSANSPAVDIKKLFKCFDNVPDFPGTTYSIKLCTDIPFNSDPTISWNPIGGNPGHTFLVITKANANVSVTQAFGFYPVDGKSNITSQSPVASKIVDDKYHEINASISIDNLSTSTFNLIRANAENVSSQKQYDIMGFNCTNFAVELFNLARPSDKQIVVQPYYANITPGLIPPAYCLIFQSPQELFKELKRLDQTDPFEAPHIAIQQSHLYRAPQTNGECN
jgi:hypothetical protein